MNRLFDRYLNLITQTASAVPAISASSRRDYEQYCTERGLEAPKGGVTGLPCGLGPDQFDTSQSPWPRPYALFVGTVEARKNHVLALRAWQDLIARHGADNVPDLVCIGRLGWNADEFLNEYVATHGLGGKVSVLSTSVTDAELARFYANADFTVYPSRYEGWGLPVSESLAFGKVAIVADNSSLPEAGRDLAVYFPSGDVAGFVHAIESAGLDPEGRERAEERIARTRTADHLAGCGTTIVDEVARDGSGRQEPVYPRSSSAASTCLPSGRRPRTAAMPTSTWPTCRTRD